MKSGMRTSDGNIKSCATSTPATETRPQEVFAVDPYLVRSREVEPGRQVDDRKEKLVCWILSSYEPMIRALNTCFFYFIFLPAYKIHREWSIRDPIQHNLC